MESQYKQSGFGVASLILGIIGMLLSCIAIGIVPCVVGLVFAIIGLSQKERKHGTAIGGLVCSVIGIGIFLLAMFVFNTTDDKSTVSKTDNRNSEIVSTEIVEKDKTESNKVEEDLVSQMEITEYSMENTIGDTYYILIVKNTSDKTVELNVNAIAKDEDGNTIGAASSSENAVGSGREACLLNYFDGVENASDFEYTLSVKEDKYYDDAIQDLNVEESRTDEKVILTVTNNGDEAAEFVEVEALFFKSGELIYYGSTYITDDEFEIKPGETISDEVDCYNSYDDVKVYFNGRR